MQELFGGDGGVLLRQRTVRDGIVQQCGDAGGATRWILEIVNSKSEIRNSKQIRMFKAENSKRLCFDYFSSFEFGACFGFRASDFEFVRTEF